MVAQVADSLVKSGKVIRGYLGVSIQNITPALTESFGLKSNKGALVSEVVAEFASLRSWPQRRRRYRCRQLVTP